MADEINRNVSNIRDVSHTIRVEAATSADNGRELSQLADKQQQLVGQFRVYGRIRKRRHPTGGAKHIQMTDWVKST